MIDAALRRRLFALACERDALLSRAAFTRREAAAAAGELAPAVAYVDIAISVARYMRAHPLLAAVGLAVASRYRGTSAISAASLAWNLYAKFLR